MNEAAYAPPYPDGMDERHIRPVAAWRRHASPLALVVFGMVVLLALSGLLGRERTWVSESSGVQLRVHSPEIIRNGEFFEMRFSVATERPIDELVIGVAADLWTDITVNTMIPAPAEEESADGELRFTFAEVPADGEFLLKVDLQVNPDIVLGNEGTVIVYDGETEVVATDVSITVLP